SRLTGAPCRHVVSLDTYCFDVATAKRLLPSPLALLALLTGTWSRLTLTAGVEYDIASRTRPLPCIDRGGRRGSGPRQGRRLLSPARLDAMFEEMTWAGVWLVQRSAALPDTIFTKQVAAVPSTFDRITGIASGVLTILFCI